MKQKNIFITGASGGFGKLSTQLLLKHGHRVIAGIRGGQVRLQEIFADELKSLPAGQLTAVDLHMEQPETFHAALAAVEKEFGGQLDVLINIAGFGLIGAFEAQTEAQVARQFNINFFGPAQLTRTLLPALHKTQGTILTMSGVAGRVSVPYLGTHCASKHALDAHTEGLYYELKPLGIQVGIVEPGAHNTRMCHEYDGKSETMDPDSPYYQATRNVERFNTGMLKYAGDPMSVAKVLVKLAEARRVRFRTSVGMDAKMMYFMKWLLPENWRVPLFEKLLRKFLITT